MPETRQETLIPLIGNATAEIRGNQLPSNREILKCYFYYTRYSSPKLTAREAQRQVVRKCALFWEYAGIPIVDESNAVKKLNKLVKHYKTILKYGSQKDEYLNYQLKEIDFVHMLDDLFDIAHKKKVSHMKNETARVLLGLHQEKGRNGALNKIIDTGEEIDNTEGDENVQRDAPESLEEVELRGIAANGANYVFDETEDVVEVLGQMEDNDGKKRDYKITSKAPQAKKRKIMNKDMIYQ